MFQSTAAKAVRHFRITTAGIFGKPSWPRFLRQALPRRSTADYLWTPCTSTKTSYCRKAPLNAFGYADDKVTMDAVLTTVTRA